MNTPAEQQPEEPGKIPAVETGVISAAIHNILNGEALDSESDRRVVAAAAAFVESPTELLPDIVRHVESVGEVLAYRDAMEQPGIPEVDKLYTRLLTLVCNHHIAAATAEHQLPTPDYQKIGHSLVLAAAEAKHLANAFEKDDTLLRKIQALQQSMRPA